MDCVMIGCFGNMRGRNEMFERYSEDDPPELVGIIMWMPFKQASKSWPPNG